MKKEVEVMPVEVTKIDGSALEVVQKAEIDTQIATAHKYPRSMEKFKARATEMVSMDEETAESCIYCRPVGKKINSKTGQMEETYAEGLSVRMAEIVGACYGNLRVGSMIVEQTPRQVKARGYAHDLESNFAASSEVIESTVTRNGEPYSERMATVVAKAALAKAFRDATFKVVPRALCKPVEKIARDIALGNADTLAKRRDAVIGWISKLGIPENRVWTALGINGTADIGLEQLKVLTGLKTAIKDGDISVDEAFPILVATKTENVKVSIDNAESVEKQSDKRPSDEGDGQDELDKADLIKKIRQYKKHKQISFEKACQELLISSSIDLLSLELDRLKELNSLLV